MIHRREFKFEKKIECGSKESLATYHAVLTSCKLVFKGSNLPQSKMIDSMRNNGVSLLFKECKPQQTSPVLLYAVQQSPHSKKRVSCMRTVITAQMTIIAV